MNEHFRAFSFVDRIASLDAGVKIEGSYAIPAGIDSFPFFLVAEALGQCAAWAGMAAVDFKYRPVSGIVGKLDFLSSVQPGEELTFTVDLESVDGEAMAYGGTAQANGVPVIKLHGVVAPMVPMEEFDEASTVRDRFALLCGQGATPGAFQGLPPFTLDHTGHQPGQRKSATLQVPASAAFFQDHFPRRHVFPGTLLMGANFQLAISLATEIPIPRKSGSWKLRSVSGTKFRAFTPPDATLQCEARLDKLQGNTAVLTVESRDADRIVASAKALFSSEEHV